MAALTTQSPGDRQQGHVCEIGSVVPGTWACSLSIGPHCDCQEGSLHFVHHQVNEVGSENHILVLGRFSSGADLGKGIIFPLPGMRELPVTLPELMAAATVTLDPPKVCQVVSP